MATTQNSLWKSSPLPPGWEAKYDDAQRRYYYINHHTQTTTWDDPRQAAWDQAMNQKLQSQQQHYGNNSWSGYSGPSIDSTPQKSPAKKPISSFTQSSYNNWEKHVEDKYGLRVQHIKDDEEETSFSSQASPVLDHNAFAKLKQIYPSVDAEVIKDVLRGVNNDQTRASQQLNALGFSPTRTPPRHDDSSPQRNFQSQIQHKLKSHKSPAPPPPTGPTESQKTRLRQKLTKEFPHCAAQVVLMALDSSQYDEAKTRILLQTTHHSSGQSSRQSSPTEMYNKDSPNSTQTIPIYATVNKTSTTAVEASSVGHMQESNHPASASNLSSISEASGSRKEHISKKSAVDRRKFPKIAMPKPELKAEGEYRSMYRTEPVGANPDIWKGPSLQNIFSSKDHVKVNGPNPANRQGSSGAKGSNPSLRVGPNKNLLCSCQSLASGSRSSSTSSILVSSS